MRNFISNLLRLSTVCIAIVGFFAPMNVNATSENLLVNGSFSAGVGGWSGANGGTTCSGGSPSAGGWDGLNGLFFSYQSGSVTQIVNIPNPSSLKLSFTASSSWGGTYSAVISDSDQTVSTGTLTAGANQISNLSITTSNNNEPVIITFTGRDALFWAGCYGPVIKNASLTIIDEPLILFDKVWENQILSLQAPEGSVFTDILFLSYGTPTGSTGNYEINQGCHATLSEQQINSLLGSNTLVIGANNSVFGDPCGGVGKWLSVVAEYSAPPPPPTTTTTTTTTIPPGSYSGDGCGPYSPIHITGAANGTGWGSGPYTDDSNFNAMAVHAGLVEVGESAWLEPYDVARYPTYPASTQNGISTSEWDGEWCGFNIKIYGSPTPTTTTTTTTTIPKFLGQPQNVQAQDTGTSIILTWDAANNNQGVSPERYAISWSDGNAGWGIATGNVGDNTALNTEIIINYSLLESTGGLDKEYSFTVRADNDSYGVYSQQSEPVIINVSSPPPPTTTTTQPEVTEPPTTEPQTTTTTEPEIITPPETVPETIPPVVIPPTTEPEIIEPETTIPEEIQPEETIPQDTEDQVDDILTGDLTQEEFSNAVDELLTSANSEEELVSAATELLSGDLSEEQFTEVINQVFAQELSDEAFAEVLNTVFDEPLSDEEFTAVIDAVLDQPLSDEQFAELVDVLSSDTVTDEQVQEAVTAIIDNGITEDQATEIATSAEVLSSITGDQAEEIFAEIPIEEITEEKALEIIAAVQDAPKEVRSAFEEEINIFSSSNLNTYVPLGSKIDVGQRRAVIAAGAVIAVAPVAGASRRR